MSALTVRILHFSDTHFLAGDARHYGVIDTRAQLRRALAAVEVGGAFDLVVCSGDVSEDGSEESYRRVAADLTAWASPRGARVVFAMGNHDRREGFRAVLGSGQLGVEAQEPAGDDPARPIVSTAVTEGLRTIVLDSSVPGRGHGGLGDDQLAFLADALRAPAPRGSVVVVHHPPIPAQTDLLQALALPQPQRLLEALRGTDVRVVLSGHYHMPLMQVVDGLPVVVTPGVTNLSRAVADPAEESATAATGGTLVAWDDAGVRVVPFVVPADAEVFHFDRAQVREIARDAGGLWG